MRIFLIRHGETDSNRARVVQTPDTPLSALGQQQAKQLANAYKQHNISLILSSDHTRTQQTALPLQRQTNAQLVPSALLTERNFGDLRGQRYADIATDFFASEYLPPGGESHQQFCLRVAEGWRWICQQAQQTTGSTAVITHGLVLRAVLSEQLKLSDAQLEQANFANTSVTEVLMSAGESRISRLCDCSHLAKPAAQGAKV